MRLLAVQGVKQPAILVVFAIDTKKAGVTTFASIEDFAAYSRRVC